MNSYKSQTYKLLRDEADVPEANREALGVNVKHYALLDDVRPQPRRRSRAPVTVTLVVIGLFAGWIGGISLTGAFQHSKPATDVPPNVNVDENAVPASQLQPDPRPSANVIAPVGKSARPREAQAESQPDVEMPPPRATRVDENKEKDDPWLGVPTGEQSTKEIGRSAMDKILKENDKLKRGKHLKANKNEE